MVMGAFGPLGELRVQPLGNRPQRFRELKRVFLGEAHAPANVLHRRLQAEHVILRLDTVKSRDAAKELHGAYLYVPESEAVRLPKGEYFVHQIVGLNVVTVEGESLGTISDVIATGSNDVYVVRGPKGEILLPATKEVVKDVDLEARTVRVALLPGLVD